jgi:cytochrome c oxidase cbb3-type subunit 2
MKKIVLAVALFSLAGCHREPPVAQVEVALAAPVASTGVSPAAAREQRERAKKLFLAECSGCHGEKGRGDGPAAALLPVPPRNFVKERFKFRTTASGEPPRRRDIFDTITRGLPGSYMPAFTFLTEEERWLLVDHVRGLAGIASEPDPDAIALGAEPPADAASIARGQAAFKKMECDKCHGATGHGDGPSAKTLVDSYDRPIQVRDFVGGVFRRGANATELHMRFRTGLDGTPMPSFGVTPEQGWDLAHYVQSLAAPKVEAPVTDPVERGRRVVETRGCFACHVIEGRGGKVGPSLDVSAQKLETAWVKEFLSGPRRHGKLYGYMPYRMPDLGLTPEEIDGVLALFAKTAGRAYPEAAPAAPQVDAARVPAGQLLYALKCAECHNLGTIIPLYEAKRQGPDLIKVAGRVRYDWVPGWVADPKAILPDSRMVKTNLTADEIESIRAFLWTVSAPARK